MTLYRLLSILNDLKAARKGRLGRRIVRKTVYRKAFNLTRTLLKVVGLCLLFAASAQAQERTPAWPYIYSTLGQASDVWTKRVAIGRGCVEANTYAYRTELPSVKRLIATKALMIGPATLTMALFDRSGHHKAARMVGLISGTLGASIATWNLSIDCGGGR